MDLFPHFPIHLDSIALFSITLILGLIGGEFAKRSYFLPIISGYIFIGFLFGPGGFNIVNQDVLATSRIFVNISLSLILFELGRHLDFRWLLRDRGLLYMGATESMLTWLAIFSFTYFFIHLSFLQSALAGTIAMATSPAVVMMVAHDLTSEGPVTRRTLILTSVNNLFALLIFTFLVPFIEPSNTTFIVKLFHAFYQLMGSVILGLTMFKLAQLIAHFIGKNKDNQFVLFIGLVMLATSLCHVFNFSALLTLFTLGVAARNLDAKNLLIEIDFAWLARLCFILLFVVTGVYLQLNNLWILAGSILIFILVRWIAKVTGIMLFAKSSNLTKQQVFALSFSLLPMACVAIGMSTIITQYNPDFGQKLLSLIAGATAILNIIGPIATQLAFIKTGEALSLTTK
jgi:Kef-type K+ transport system membrane component KefB